jgi:putative ABC transport system permease protein
VNLLEVLRTAARALTRNKTRSLLTTLGIVIGVAAVIAMVAIGEGAKRQVEASFASMGANLLIVLPGTTTAGGVQGGFGSMPTLTWDDLAAIQSELPSVRGAAAAMRSAAQIEAEGQNWTTSVTGTSPVFFDLRAWPMAHGALFSDSDVEGGAKTAVLGQTVVDKVFGANAEPVGRTIRIRGVPFEVVGVLARKGQSPQGQDYDDAVYVPQTTYQAKIQGGLQKYVNGVFLVAATAPETTATAEREMSGLLRERHHIQAGMDDDFSIRNLAEMASASQAGTRTLTTLLASIAAVSLLVGGIGIMNIMLVSVTERTREIGLRMAVGAKGKNILAQFLVEALTLSIAGGAIGVALGLAAAVRLAAQFHWPLAIRFDIVALAVGTSALVGVAFGLYPALQASRLDPIEALRYE